MNSQTYQSPSPYPDQSSSKHRSSAPSDQHDSTQPPPPSSYAQPGAPDGQYGSVNGMNSQSTASEYPYPPPSAATQAATTATPITNGDSTLGPTSTYSQEKATAADGGMHSAVNHDSAEIQTPVRNTNGQGSGISLVFKRPPASASTKDDQGSTPGSTSSSGRKKRRMEVAPNPSRASRSRYSPPTNANSTSTPSRSHESSPFPSNTHDARTGGNALSIFAPPPPSALPEVLQDVIGSSTSASSSRRGTPTRSGNAINGATANGSTPGDGGVDKGGDTMMKEAAQGFNSRLRSNKAKEIVVVKTGVSASGKDVRVSSAAKEAGKTIKKKGKSKAGDGEVPNQDFCSACRGVGRFLCCDGCPRSFHFMCLEPPLQIDELPEEEVWYCKKCRAERSRETPSGTPQKEKEIRPIPTVFKSLVKRVEDENPSQFKLPQDIRQYFAGVSTDARGNYFDSEETRTKYDRKGFQEERDGTKLRDGKSRPVACYACGGTSIPLRTSSTDPESAWRPIVSCDYCALHWHLDCLNPPLASMPNSGRKWMCPNHAEQVMARRRTVRQHLETVDVESSGTPNNGNIIIMPDEEGKQHLDFEDMVINKKKYRVPEKVIRLDFWNKLKSARGPKKAPKRHRVGSESSLTSLGSSNRENTPDESDMMAANLILAFSQAPLSSARSTTNADTASTTRQSTAPATDGTKVERMSPPATPTLSQAPNASKQGMDVDPTPTPSTVAGNTANSGTPSGQPRIVLRFGNGAGATR